MFLVKEDFNVNIEEIYTENQNLIIEMEQAFIEGNIIFNEDFIDTLKDLFSKIINFITGAIKFIVKLVAKCISTIISFFSKNASQNIDDMMDDIFSKNEDTSIYEYTYIDNIRTMIHNSPKNKDEALRNFIKLYSNNSTLLTINHIFSMDDINTLLHEVENTFNNINTFTKYINAEISKDLEDNRIDDDETRRIRKLTEVIDGKLNQMKSDLIKTVINIKGGTQNLEINVDSSNLDELQNDDYISKLKDILNSKTKTNDNGSAVYKSINKQSVNEIQIIINKLKNSYKSKLEQALNIIASIRSKFEKLTHIDHILYRLDNEILKKIVKLINLFNMLIPLVLHKAAKTITVDYNMFRQNLKQITLASLNI